jgi:Viral BACON domain/6-bladed beta-propeller
MMEPVAAVFYEKTMNKCLEVMKVHTLLSYSMNNRLVSFLSLVVLFVLLPFSANATVIPVFERLDPLTVQVNRLTIVTLDKQGRVYIGESGSNLVRIFSQSGSHIHTITGLANPVSLAVDSDGRIYIGNHDRGNVEVYDASFQHLFNLGLGNDDQGTDEFGIPNDIAIDASGLIYVVDKAKSAIKLYNSNGSYNSSLGQTGNGDGEFYHPVSLVIDTVANELVVLDLQQRLDQFTNTWIDGARIQFLQMDGTFKRGYTKFGYDRDNGELVLPVHLAVDSQSRVYVSDCRLQKVMIFENNGDFLGMIDSAASPFRIPLGIAMGKTNKLYVASLLAGQVEIYGIDNYIGMEVNPASLLSFEELQGEASGEMKTIGINNTGNSTFTWTADSKDSWISLPAAQGDIPASSPATVNVGVDINGLDPGQYQGSVTITAETAVTETVIVSLTVLPNAMLSVSPTSLTFASTVGITPASQTLDINNGGGSTLNWNANADQSWLTLNATSGTAPSALKVYADITSLPAGSYSGTVTVTRQTDPSDMQAIPVSLTLTEPSEAPTVPPAVTNPGDNTREKKWSITQVLPGTSLNGIWGSSSTNLLVVGAEGSIIQYDGKTWSEMASGVTANLYGIWGSSLDDVYAVGENGKVLHYDGSDWGPPLTVIVEETLRDIWGSSASDVYVVSRNGSILESFSNAVDEGVALRGVWGSSESDVFVVGENGAILRYNGTSWDSMDSDTTQWLNGIWGSSASDVFAVGENGAIIHFDGTTWNSMESGTTVSLQSVWGSSGSDVFAVGADGLILYYNGSSWYSVPTAVTDGLNDVWVSDKSEVFAVGENGTVVYGICKAKFPWLLILQNIILVNAAAQNEKKEEKLESKRNGFDL